MFERRVRGGPTSSTEMSGALGLRRYRVQRDGSARCMDVEAKRCRAATCTRRVPNTSSLFKAITLATTVAMLLAPSGAMSTSELVIYPTEATGDAAPVTIPASGRWYYGPRELKLTNTSAVILDGAELCNAPVRVEGRVVITTEVASGCGFNEMYVS